LSPETEISVGAETIPHVEGDRGACCTTGKAECRGLETPAHRDQRTRHVPKGHPGTWDGVSAPLSSDRTGTAREIEPAGRREVGARSRSNDVGELAPGDPAEQRSAPENTTLEGTRTESPSSLDISTKLERIATLAGEIRGASIRTLAHHIDVDWLREAYRRTRKDGALSPPARGPSTAEPEASAGPSPAAVIASTPSGLPTISARFNPAIRRPAEEEVTGQPAQAP
jgi:hypothetical protein